MNLEQTAPQPSQAQSGSSSALATTLHSSRTSPFPPPTLADREAMATPGFLTATQAFRPLHSAQSQFSVNMPSNTLFERESIKPVGTPFASSPAPMVRVLIRRLPLNTSEESLRLMVVWSKDLANVELLPIEQSEDKGFRSAILRFKNMAGAMEATNMLDGRSNISNDAEMIVEVLSSSPISARRLATDSVTANGNNQNSVAVSSTQGPRQPQRFNGAFQPLDKVSSANGLFSPAHEFPNPESSSHYQSLFSPQSPIGNHLTERGARISGKTLISSDFGDDDETSDLLKDPVAYAENGATSQRRATAPQIPISQMNGLSINTSNQNGPSSLPPYITSLSPVNAPAPGLSYPGPPAQPFGRHNFPPVNPADQNPPCNTLYVGNLPIDTSEEELKAMFSKQRGYKRLCFRTKQNGPMCFVEFEDISFATKALHELYGHPLHNSVKGGIRLSFSKNPLGVRSGQAPSQPSQGAMAAMNGMMAGSANGFTTANGPPPGLSAPPGLGTGRANYNLNTGGTHRHHNAMSGIAPASGHPWNAPLYHNGMAVGHNAVLGANTNHLPRHMMGR